MEFEGEYVAVFAIFQPPTSSDETDFVGRSPKPCRLRYIASATERRGRPGTKFCEVYACRAEGLTDPPAGGERQGYK
jgi:hypothetical protein